MTYQKLLDILIAFYTDPRWNTVYAGRWDVWCIQNGNMEAYKHLICKPDRELEHLKARAKLLAHSPLGKALS